MRCGHDLSVAVWPGASRHPYTYAPEGPVCKHGAWCGWGSRVKSHVYVILDPPAQDVESEQRVWQQCLSCAVTSVRRCWAPVGPSQWHGAVQLELCRGQSPEKGGVEDDESSFHRTRREGFQPYRSRCSVGETKAGQAHRTTCPRSLSAGSGAHVAECTRRGPQRGRLGLTRPVQPTLCG